MNAEFANRLINAKTIEDQTEKFEEQIKNVGKQIADDTIHNLGPGRYKNHVTVAALLAYSSIFRATLTRVDYETFDRIVESARTKLLEIQNTKPTGVKIIQAINRVPKPESIF